LKSKHIYANISFSKNALRFFVLKLPTVEVWNLEMFPILQLPIILQQEPITVLQANVNVYLFLVQIY